MDRSVFSFLGALILITTTKAWAQGPDSTPRDDILALHRLELRPNSGWALTPNSVTGAFVGADLAFRLHPVFALGGDAAWYEPFDGSGGANPSYPLNKTSASVNVDAHFVPFPAHSPPSVALGAFEPYLLVGLGLISTRPISVVDSANRHFEADNHAVDLGFGLGVHFFITPWAAVVVELRDLVYSERVESRAVARDPLDRSFWYDSQSHMTNSIQLRIGASFLVAGG